jgi:predicted nucleotidyltransferase
MKTLKEINYILKEHKEEILQKYRAKVKGVFGSYVRAEENKESDIDALVEFEDNANLIDFVGLSLFLEEKLKCRVDVVPEDAIRKEIKPSILREAVYI